MLAQPSNLRRIVVIEDSAADANLLRIALEKTGSRLDIHVIADGMQALAYFENAATVGIDCDLVLLDLNVPIINGFEILERIKSHAYLKKIPVIILSGSAHDSDIERCYQSGANCYLSKPSALAEFMEMISRFVDCWLRCARLPARQAGAKIVSRVG